MDAPGHFWATNIISTSVSADRKTDGGARGEILRERRAINLVHAVELRHVGHEDRRVDNIASAEARRLQRPSHARQHFRGLRLHIPPVRLRVAGDP